MVHRGSKEKRSHAERQEHKAHVPLGDTGAQGSASPWPLFPWPLFPCPVTLRRVPTRLKVRNVDLTVLVVKELKGRPGSLRGIQDWDAERESSYNINWYGVTPPTPQDFRE